MTLLKELARRAKGRHDAKLPLSEIAPSLDIRVFVGGARFVDSENPRYEGSSDLAYDFSTLYEEGLIRHTYLDYERDTMGGVVGKTAVAVTIKGLEAAAEASKSWLKKAIEQQPMTFLQIVVYVMIALVTGIGGWAIGRYITPAAYQKQPATQQAVPSEQPAAGARK